MGVLSAHPSDLFFFFLPGLSLNPVLCITHTHTHTHTHVLPIDSCSDGLNWNPDSYFIFFSATVAYGHSWARDGISAPAATYATAVAMLDPLTHCATVGTPQAPLAVWSVFHGMMGSFGCGVIILAGRGLLF